MKLATLRKQFDNLVAHIANCVGLRISACARQVARIASTADNTIALNGATDSRSTSSSRLCRGGSCNAPCRTGKTAIGLEDATWVCHA